jgi:hypothetical protein
MSSSGSGPGNRADHDGAEYDSADYGAAVGDGADYDAAASDSAAHDSAASDSGASDSGASDAAAHDNAASDSADFDSAVSNRADFDSELPARIAELAGEISEARTETRRRRIAMALPRLAGRGGRIAGQGAWRGGRIAGLGAWRGGRGAWTGLRYGGRWLTTQVLAMAPRIPIRNLETLRSQFPGLPPEELADALIEGAARAAAGVGASVGAAAVLPVVPALPVEIGVETLAVVGIELKLIAELHEVYGMRPPGSAAERAMAYVDAWAHRRGVGLAPGGLVLAIGSPVRRRLERRLLARAGRSATSLGPLLTGAAAGALLNRRETRRLGHEIRDDLRRRSQEGARWPDSRQLDGGVNRQLN